MTKKSIHSDYANPEAFWKAMESAYRNPATAFADKRLLINKLIAKKINETAWKRLGGDRYLGEKNSFYYNLESRLSSIYLKMIRRESIANQVYQNLREFLRTSIDERKTKTQNITQNISEGQQPLLSLGDMSGGSYGAYKNRADWIQASRGLRSEIRTNEGVVKMVKLNDKGEPEKDDKGNYVKGPSPMYSTNWKTLEERVGVGAILNALQFVETDLEQEFKEIQSDLMSPIDFSDGKFYTDYATGRVKFQSWEDIENEVEPGEEPERDIKSFRYDRNTSYQENWKNKLVFLRKELKITRDQDMIQTRVNSGESLIEAWDAPIELKTEEEFNEIDKEVIGFEEFIEEIRNYLKTVNKKRKSGKQILPSQRFYLLLGDPGIGKTYIAGMIAKYLGKQFFKINCAAAHEGDIIGNQQTYRGASLGNVAKTIIEGKDRSPVIVFDEVDKCRDENVLNIISILFDDTTNVHDFKDVYLDFPIPMNEVFFIATANNLKKLKEVADFVLHRCTMVNIKPLTYHQRIALAKKAFESNLKHMELEQYLPRIKEKLLKKCLVRERGIRQTKINTKKIVDQLDALDTKYGGDKIENAGKNNIPSDIDFATRKWSGLIVSDGLDVNCPASWGKEHVLDHKCFEPENIPGWTENMGE